MNRRPVTETCTGSGGPNFLDAGDERHRAATTITGDIGLPLDNVDYRLDTASARAFLGQSSRCRKERQRDPDGSKDLARPRAP